MPKKRVTLQDIADETGFHVTTVSGVLRGKTNFSKKTADAIREAAERMGYVPDPMLTALAAYRAGSRQATAGNQLAVVILGPREHLEDWGFELILPGIKQAAQSRGFSVELFCVTEKGMSWRRLGDILHARGIQGVIFPGGPEADMTIPDSFPWDRFSAVTIDDCIVQPASIHRVMNHRGKNLSMAIERCVKAGRRRLALATFADRETRQHHAETGVFLGGLIHYGLDADIPVHAPKALDPADYLAWFDQYRPDAVLCSHHDLVDGLLSENRVGVPQKTALLHYHMVEESEPYAGILTNFKYIGEKAVDTVVDMMHRDERGLPEHNIFLQVPGVWHPGKTFVEEGG